MAHASWKDDAQPQRSSSYSTDPCSGNAAAVFDFRSWSVQLDSVTWTSAASRYEVRDLGQVHPFKFKFNDTREMFGANVL